MDTSTILSMAHETFTVEIDAVKHVKDQLNDSFAAAVNLILQSAGKVIVTGIGKSGNIARKITATLCSTGTLAVFLHPAEGLHGDLGVVTKDDVVIALSKSGTSDEILAILPVLKKIGARLIAMVGNLDSPLAQAADVVLNVTVEKEACPLDLAPTASTTAMLVMGDALAVTLLNLHDFKPQDYALFHPGGRLGKRLLLTVADVMHSGEENPRVGGDVPLPQVIIEMTSKAMGAVNVVEADQKLVGIITDGDLRRALQHQGSHLLNLTAADIMTRHPISVTPQTMAVDAIRLMENRPSQIMVLPVVDDHGRAVGIVRLHDLVRAGL
ncbi:MAG: KpsF/GutQ family sugar-phosphate isomerase [Gemmatimonadetes bacterium]|nr:MAG: KpsF/GutQ family sugar-phosphate isomerase [Gemmatimonadota bacterium]